MDEVSNWTLGLKLGVQLAASIPNLDPGYSAAATRDVVMRSTRPYSSACSAVM